MNLILLVLSALLPFLACICLAYSQSKHAREIFGRGVEMPDAKNSQRWGWSFLCLGLLSSLLTDTVDFAIILWPMFFGAAALAVACLIAVRPAWLRAMVFLPGLKHKLD